MKLHRKALFISSFILGVAAILVAGCYLTGCYNGQQLAEKHVTAEKHVIRAAIDIGSGATKLRVVELNLKTRKIEKILVNESFTVPYQEKLLKSSDQTFDEQVMQQGLESMQKSKEIAKKYNADKIIAVATAAFRKAVNAPEFIAKIQQETGIPVFIIDQELEGKLAYEAASAEVKDPENMIVWDIGGGSLQLTMQNSEGDFEIYRGHDASVPFKNFIIQDIQRRNIEYFSSPNPMTRDEIQQATSHARDIASKVDKIFKERIQQPKTQVVGVGNVFAYGISPMVNKQPIFTQTQLANVVAQLADKTDWDMGNGDFANVSISNAILILGFMQELNIHEMLILDINNADGAFLYPPFWENAQILEQ